MKKNKGLKRVFRKAGISALTIALLVGSQNFTNIWAEDTPEEETKEEMQENTPEEIKEESAEPEEEKPEEPVYEVEQENKEEEPVEQKAEEPVEEKQEEQKQEEEPVEEQKQEEQPAEEKKEEAPEYTYEGAIALFAIWYADQTDENYEVLYNYMDKLSDEDYAAVDEYIMSAMEGLDDGIMTMDANAATYTVNIGLDSSLVLNNATITFKGDNHQYRWDNCQISGGLYTVTGVEEDQYEVQIIGTNPADGEDWKGTATLYSWMFTNYAKDGILNAFGVWSFRKDVKGTVPVEFTFNNPYPAGNGMYYPFELTTAYLINMADNSTVTLTIDGSVASSQDVPASQTYALAAAGYAYKRIDGGTIDLTEKYSFGPMGWRLGSTFENEVRGTVTVPTQYVQTEKLPQNQFHPTITIIEPDGSAVTDAWDVEITLPDGTTRTGTTTNGVVTIDVPMQVTNEQIANIPLTSGSARYSIKVTSTTDDRTAQTVVRDADISGYSGTTNVNMYLPAKDAITVITEAYIDGNKMGPYSTKYSFSTFTTIQSGIPYGGELVNLVKVEVFDKDGNEISGWAPYPGSLASMHSDINSVKDPNTGSIKAGDTITAKLYLEYNDKDSTYPVKVKHNYQVNNVTIASYTEPVRNEKAGDYISVLPIYTAGDYILVSDVEKLTGKDLSQYTGAWMISTTEAYGGQSGSLYGDLNNVNGNGYYDGPMIHTALDLVYNYKYCDAFVEYLANAADAQGAMALSWGQSGSYVDAKDINGGSMARTINGYTRNGYNFKGWNTKADGSGTWYQAGDQVMLDKDNPVRLYAQWTPISSSTTQPVPVVPVTPVTPVTPVPPVVPATPATPVAPVTPAVVAVPDEVTPAAAQIVIERLDIQDVEQGQYGLRGSYCILHIFIFLLAAVVEAFLLVKVKKDNKELEDGLEELDELGIKA